jgi:hypothetical protein
MKEFYWNEETVDYFADLYDLNGWAHAAQRIFSFVLNECDVQDGESLQDLFNDLTVKVENRIFKKNEEWIEAKLLEDELD